MKTLRFEGGSDDTFGEYNVFGDDYDNCADGSPIVWQVGNAKQALYVIGQYSPNGSGTWSIGVEMDHEAGLPDWPMRLIPSPECEYSMALEIDVPDDVTIRCVTACNEEDDPD